MGISSAVNISLSGMQVNQRELDLVAGNIANADTPGYTRKTLSSANITGGKGDSIGVRELTVQRAYDGHVMAQYRSSLAEASGLGAIADVQSRLDAMYGRPGDINALDTLYNDFTASLEALATSPEDFAARAQVIGDARTLAARLNAMSSEIQDMRMEAEQALADGVTRINRLFGQLQDADTQIITLSSTGRTPVGLLDERDRMITELSSLIDVRVREEESGAVRLYTDNGTLLFDRVAPALTFDAAGTVTPQTIWDSDPAQRGVGTVSMMSPSGFSLDLIATDTFSSGALKATVDLRDSVLVQAQAQLDELAHAMSLALSDRRETGTAATAGAQSGFDIDLSGLQRGNAVRLDYVDVAGGETRTVTFVRVDDPTVPLGDTATATPGDSVHGIDFSGGMTAAAADIAAALGAGFTVSDQGGDVLRILDDGGATTTVAALSASITTTGLVDEGVGLPFFVDGGSGSTPYTASLEGARQKTGYAARIMVNSALVSDPSRLVVFETGPQTPDGDATRPLAMIERLDAAGSLFSAETGIGSHKAPFSGTVSGFVRQLVTFRGSAMASAEQAAGTQEIIVNSLRERRDATSKVDVDQELGRLLELQTAYAANARVMQAARDMLDILMRM